MRREIPQVEPWMVQFIKDRDLVVLRDKRGKALNISFSEEGLRWTCNKYGRALYYEDAYLKHILIDDMWHPYISGNKEKSSRVVVEKFIPRNHTKLSYQIAEFMWCNKAIKLLNMGSGVL